MIHLIRNLFIYVVEVMSIGSSSVTKFISDYATVLFYYCKSFYYINLITTSIQKMLIFALRTGPVPAHVAFIMDGNRRFAKSKDIPLRKGHEAGGETLLTLVYICKTLGVKCISAYAFSIENFNRPREEVETLMNLFGDKLDEFAQKANDYKDPLYGSSLRIVGDRSLISPELRERIENVEKLTENSEKFILYICFPYTSRNDIFQTVTKVTDKYVQSNIIDSNLSIDEFTKSMHFKEYSDNCDILIRTSGHKRLSDFMLWQVNQHATMEFSTSLWPQFNFFQMYLIILRWSMFKMFQIYNMNNVSKHSKFGSKLYKPYKTILKYIFSERLPDPPMAVPVTNR